MKNSIETDHPKNILFLTDRWCPNATANAVCINNIAQVLIRDGWTVYVSAISDGDIISTVIDGIHVETIKTSIHKRLLRKAEECKGTLIPLFIKKIAKLLYFAKRMFLIPIYPVGAPLFARKWGKVICQLIDQYEIDLLISVNAPEESVYTGYLVKRANSDIKWGIYYIDSGTNVLHGASFERLKLLLQKKSVKWEQKAFAYAEKIFVMQGHADYYRQVVGKRFVHKLEVVDVPLLCSECEVNRSLKNKQMLRWVYAGSLTKRYYDPHVICELFAAYKERHDMAHLDLYGQTDREKYLNDISQNCKSGIHWHGSTPHERILKVFNQADLLVYYKTEGLDSVSGKFFEYIATGKPIIYIGYPDDINSKLVIQYPLGLALNVKDSIEVKLKKIDEFLDRIVDIKAPAYEVLKKQFWLSSPETTAHLLEGL